MQDYILKKRLFWLLLITPIGWLVGFVLEISGFKSISSYFSLISFLYLISTFVKLEEKIPPGIFLLTVYFGFNVLRFDGSLIKASRESIEFVLLLASLLLAKPILSRCTTLNIFKVKNQLLWGVTLFILIYATTAIIAGPRVQEGIDKTRIYYDGFINSHAFSYYAILLGALLLMLKARYYPILLIILSFIVGNRSCVIVLFFVALFLFENYINKKVFSNFIKVTCYIAFLALLYFLYHFLTGYYSITELQDLFLNDENTEFTSGRTTLWYNSLIDFVFNGDVNQFIFGKGPDAFENLSMRLYNNTLWAHNDFVQVLYCYGLFGISAYFLLLFKFCKDIGNYTFFLFVLAIGSLNGFYKYGALQIIFIMCFIQYAQRTILLYKKYNDSTTLKVS